MPAAKKKALTALAYLADVDKHPPRPICVAYGDDAFLQAQVRDALRGTICGGGDGEAALTTYSGRAVDLCDVLDGLRTVSLFGDRRMIEIENADEFVQRHRAALEDYATAPSSAAVLLLLVSSWPGNTRLARELADSGLVVDCKRPAKSSEAERRAKKWLPQRARDCHGFRFSSGGAELLVERVGPDLGLLDQELSKLAVLAEGGTVTDAQVEQTAGSWRTRTVWEMLDAMLDGRAAIALTNLDRLLLAGEHPVAILGQIGSSLRRFSAAARIYADAQGAGGRVSLKEALQQAGILHFKLRDAERQLKRLGRPRALRLAQRLLAADLALKGASSAPDRARLVVERLLVETAAFAEGTRREPSPMVGAASR
ncbi:MAG: DNA polymerase III subunit delta [Planctomycetota bacterium]|nr:MAG: DNA polymerase III subunit delta [Planctomycetota bacterium]REJ89571.1 MAG: DNA polymerase III subunit delta [Planctomycetota bacterium]